MREDGKVGDKLTVWIIMRAEPVLAVNTREVGGCR